MARFGKRTRTAREAIVSDKEYPLSEAIELLCAVPSPKFDESVELAVNLGVDPRQSDQNVRGMVSLPHGTGRSVRVAVFAQGAKAEEAKTAGADIVGAQDLADKVQAGEMDFDRVIATPDLMPLVGRLGRVLGPRGLMPNPKLGTVTMDVTAAVNAAKSGQVEYRVDKAGIVHAAIGKRSFTPNQLHDNTKAFMDAVRKAKPQSAKQSYLQKVSISTTMGPGLRLDPATL